MQRPAIFVVAATSACFSLVLKLGTSTCFAILDTFIALNQPSNFLTFLSSKTGLSSLHFTLLHKPRSLIVSVVADLTSTNELRSGASGHCLVYDNKHNDISITQKSVHSLV